MNWRNGGGLAGTPSERVDLLTQPIRRLFEQRHGGSAAIIASGSRPSTVYGMSMASRILPLPRIGQTGGSTVGTRRQGLQVRAFVGIVAVLASACSGTDDDGRAQTSDTVALRKIETSLFGMPVAPPVVRIAAFGLDGGVHNYSAPGSVHIADWGARSVPEPAFAQWPAVLRLAEGRDLAVLLGEPNERPERIEVRVFDEATDERGQPLNEPLSTIECDLIAETCKTLVSADGLSVVVPIALLPRGVYGLVVWGEWKDWPVWDESADSEIPVSRRGWAAWLFRISLGQSTG